MEIVLNRRGGVPVRDQLIVQLEMRILDGSLAEGQKLPSVRALARRLKIHANTVSAAYRDLESTGRVRLRRGSGVYVVERGPRDVASGRSLDEMIRLALLAALRAGHRGPEIRAAIERWLQASPPDRIVVVDNRVDVAELLALELGDALGPRPAALDLEVVKQRPEEVAGALVLALPHLIAAIREAAPGAAVEELRLEVGSATREEVKRLPAGSIVLAVSSSTTALFYASTLLRSLRGDEVLVETRPLSATREWKRLLAAADLVLTDASGAATLEGEPARRLHVARLIPEVRVERLRQAARTVVPAGATPTAGRRRR